MADLVDLFDAAEPASRPEFVASLRAGLLSELGAPEAAVESGAAQPVKEIALVGPSATRARLSPLRLAVVLGSVAAVLVVLVVRANEPDTGVRTPALPDSTAVTTVATTAPVVASTTAATSAAPDAATATVGPERARPPDVIVLPDASVLPGATAPTPSAAPIEGVVSYEEHCIALTGRGGRRPLVFPPGTRMVDGRATLRDGRAVPDGAMVHGGGGLLSADSLANLLGRSPGLCVRQGEESAVFWSADDMSVANDDGVVIASFPAVGWLVTKPVLLAHDGRAVLVDPGGEFSTESRLVLADRAGRSSVRMVERANALGLGPDGALYLLRANYRTTVTADAKSVELVDENVIAIATVGARSGSTVATSHALAPDVASECALEADGVWCKPGGKRTRVLAYDVDASGNAVAPMTRATPLAPTARTVASTAFRAPTPLSLTDEADDNNGSTVFTVSALGGSVVRVVLPVPRSTIAESFAGAFDRGSTTCVIATGAQDNAPTGLLIRHLTVGCVNARGVTSVHNATVAGGSGWPYAALDDTGLFYVRSNLSELAYIAFP